MNKVNPITCVATSNQKVEIPDNHGRNIVLYFYPKDDTPGCTIEGNDFSALNKSFTDQNNNNRYDDPEPIGDSKFNYRAIEFSESFIDAGNGKYDNEETFNDTNGDGIKDLPDFEVEK